MSPGPRRLSLGIYHRAVESPLAMMTLEPWVWTAVGLAGRPPHRRAALLRTATVHSMHSAWMWWRLHRRPELVLSKRWVATHIGMTMARCGIYPAIAPRSSYWQGKADDAAFFMQAWTPMVLLGGAGAAPIAHPATATATGFAVGLTVYISAALLNGERPGTVNWTLVRRVLNYSVSLATVGYVVNVVVQLLHDASEELAKEQEDFRASFEQEGWRRKARDEALREWQGTLEMLNRLQDAARRHFAAEPEVDDMVISLEEVKFSLSEASIPDWRPMAFGEVAEEAAAGWPLKIRVDPSSTQTRLEAEEVLVVRMFLMNALGNSFDHGEATEVDVSCTVEATDRVAVTVLDNGKGLSPKARIRPGHGLARVRGYLANLSGDITMKSSDHGGTEVVACWSRTTTTPS